MNNTDFHPGIFIFGCIGALAPEIVRLYNLRTKSQFRFRWSRFYVLISVLFALLGGIIACILPSTTYYGAFYAGVAAPVMVTTIKRNSDPKIGAGQGGNDILAQSAPPSLAEKPITIAEVFRNYWQAL